MMTELVMHAMRLYADGLTLVYHEARHVRFLIHGNHMSAVGWAQFVSLQRNRVEAWRQLQPLRKASRQEKSVAGADQLFQERFNRGLSDLVALYENPNWKHSACGGNAWRDVTQLVINLQQSLNREDRQEIKQACSHLINGHHNNGSLRDKVTGLDQSIGVTTDDWWLNNGV